MSSPLPPIALVAHLGSALAARGVVYCQWKGSGKPDRWGAGLGDIDLLVDGAALGTFLCVVDDLGFKPAVPAAGRSTPGVFHFFGLDESTGRLVHLHTYTRLVLGSPWRQQYRIPIERAVLDSAVPGAVFPVPAPHAELLLLVLSLTLRHSWLDAVRHRRWLSAAQAQLARLDQAAHPGHVAQLLSRLVPDVDLDLFARCRRSLDPSASTWRRCATRRRLERALATHAGSSPSAEDTARSIWRRWLPAPRHRLATGGAVVALLGGDGAGKSTCARTLASWLAPELAAERAHLGLPQRSVATMLVGAVLKVARFIPWAAVAAHCELARFVCTARDRYRACRRAWRLAGAGGVAFCERYPLRENWSHAGPSDAQGRLIGVTSWLAARLRRWEHRYYDRMPRPNLVFVLRLDPDTAVRRKPTEPAAYVRERARQVWEADWARNASPMGARVIDATRPVGEVVAALKRDLWRAL